MRPSSTSPSTTSPDTLRFVTRVYELLRPWRHGSHAGMVWVLGDRGRRHGRRALRSGDWLAQFHDASPPTHAPHRLRGARHGGLARGRRLHDAEAGWHGHAAHRRGRGGAPDRAREPLRPRGSPPSTPRCAARARLRRRASTACARWRSPSPRSRRPARAARPRSSRGSDAMPFPRVLTADDAAALVPDGAVVTVSSSSGLGCPDAVLAAIGRRFRESGHPRGLTTLHPIAAGDMWGVKGIDHLAQDGCLARIIAGSYPSGPSSAEPPAIWRMITDDRIPAYKRAVRHPLRHAPRGRRQAPGRLHQGGPRHLRRSRPRGLRHERPRPRASRSCGARASPARSGCSSPPSSPRSASCARRRPTSAATSPSSTRAAISARSTRLCRSATTAASSSPR